ncbi:MAG: TonB-dependent receptor [Gammaproteobacteria bacterium]|nr:TonB-dependent receptor [Gammaproteobacteria bacterium]
MFYKKKLICTSIAMAMAGTVLPAAAQSSGMIEEVTVTGIRGSLQRAMDIKRDSKGVVDAISAEDIGKFPDTNLAESLQRITGVSIDRSNNEGSKVTVRGFGPEFNLVTLNNRQMPTTELTRSTRSFDFANLASEGVSGIEVYKTSGATRQSGGIGSTINIKTARPLDNPGFKASLGAKALMDSTNEKGDDITPEISGIVSNTFADDTFGVGLFLSSQKRDSRSSKGEVASWRENIDSIVNSNLAPGASVVDNRSAEALAHGNTWYPRNYELQIEDISRTRTNGQLVFQYAPTDAITTTLDYTYSKFENESERLNTGIWFAPDADGLITQAEIDSNGTYAFVEETCCDYSANKAFNESENENNSIGLNVDWQATDNLNLNFDFHDSDAISQGVGRGDSVFLILAAPNIVTKSADFRTGTDLPLRNIVWDTNFVGVENGLPTAASQDSLFGEARGNKTESDITQFQFAGTWENDVDSGITSIEFGMAHTDYTFRTRSFYSGQIAAGWYGGNQDVYDNSIFTRESLNNILDEFSGGGGDLDPDFYYDWDFEKGIAAFEEEFNGGQRLQAPFGGTPQSDHEINEKTFATYIQFNAEGDFNDLPVTLSGGIRYEDTDISASSLQRDTVALVWQGPTEWGTNLASDSSFSDEKGDYAVWLPNIDFSVEFSEDLVGRVSYSQSISRPTLDDMRATTSVTSAPKPGERTADTGNPDLKPFTSDNFDLSLEWYFDESSYVSVGYFRKLVDNFIVKQTVDQTIGDLRDPQSGPRAIQAQMDIDAGSGNNLHDQININLGNATGTPIVQDSADPLANFRVTTPSNLETATLYGFEVAAQYMFGESGFGVQANATIVKGDIDPDVSQTGFQFVLPGLSDSANLVAFYDKDGLQARIAYNWRDEFLRGTENNQPQFTEEYGQVDLNVSYETPWVEGLTVIFEGINVFDDSQRVYNRFDNQLRTATQFGARYNIGVRYTY